MRVKCLLLFALHTPIIDRDSNKYINIINDYLIFIQHRNSSLLDVGDRKIIRFGHIRKGDLCLRDKNSTTSTLRQY